MSAVDRARELGAQHGRQAAEAWWGLHGWCFPETIRAWLDNPTEVAETGAALPEPVVNGEYVGPDFSFADDTDAYCAAFREARDETIRAHAE